MKAKKRPFCPKCGKNEFVSILSAYLETWKCVSCQIKFDFSDLGPVIFLDENIEPVTTAEADYPTLDPVRIDGYWPVIGPATKIYFEQGKNRVRLTADMESLKVFLKSPELQSKLPDTSGCDNPRRTGHINLKDGTVDSVDF